MISWYPSHINKAKSKIREMLKIVDLVVEVLDARAPLVSRAYEHSKLFGSKKRILLLNKSDLADPSVTDKWIKVISKKWPVIAISTRHDKPEKVLSFLKGFSRKMETRLMLVGIPNVGKSSVVNFLGRRRATKVGGIPGITRGPHLIRIARNLLLLDTPGILYPRLTNRELTAKLLLIGALDVDKVDPVLVYEEIENILPENLKREKTLFQLLEDYSKKRGIPLRNGELDVENAMKRLVRDIAQGKMGRFSLETPRDENF